MGAQPLGAGSCGRGVGECASAPVTRWRQAPLLLRMHGGTRRPVAPEHTQPPLPCCAPCLSFCHTEQATSWCSDYTCCLSSFTYRSFPSITPTGYIVVLDYKGYANGQLFEDTTARGKPIVFLYGKRPYSGGMCAGVEKALATMRAGEAAGGGACLCARAARAARRQRRGGLRCVHAPARLGAMGEVQQRLAMTAVGVAPSMLLARRRPAAGDHPT